MRPRCALLALVLVGACGGERAPAPVAARAVIAPRPIRPPSVAAPPPKPDGRLVSARARALPERFVADGALGEWGAATATNAASRVVFGIGSTRVGVAAELRAAARDGIWVKVRFPAFELSDLQEDAYLEGPNKLPRCAREHPKDAAAMKACSDEVEGRQKRFHAQLFARFVRVYRVDASGVRLLVGDKLEPIAGASAATRADADGLAIEAELPLAALPRTAEAPIANVSVAASVEADPAAVVRAAEVESKLEPPVAFEPNADVRAVIFDGAETNGWARYHYQPGDSGSIGVSGFPPLDKLRELEDRSRYTETTEQLFVRLRAYSNFDIVKIYPDKLGTMRDGRLVSNDQGDRNLLGFVERNDELHAFFFSRGAFIIEDMVHGAYDLPGATWKVLTIRRDGTVKLTLHGQAGPFKRFLREAHAPDFSAFSVEGEAAPQDDPDGQGARAIARWAWQWDTEEKIYRETFKRTKLGGAPKP